MDLENCALDLWKFISSYLDLSTTDSILPLMLTSKALQKKTYLVILQQSICQYLQIDQDLLIDNTVTCELF